MDRKTVGGPCFVVVAGGVTDTGNGTLLVCGKRAPAGIREKIVFGIGRRLKIAFAYHGRSRVALIEIDLRGDAAIGRDRFDCNLAGCHQPMVFFGTVMYTGKEAEIMENVFGFGGCILVLNRYGIISCHAATGVSGACLCIAAGGI